VLFTIVSVSMLKCLGYIITTMKYEHLFSSMKENHVQVYMFVYIHICVLYMCIYTLFCMAVILLYRNESKLYFRYDYEKLYNLQI